MLHMNGNAGATTPRFDSLTSLFSSQSAGMEHALGMFSCSCHGEITQEESTMKCHATRILGLVFALSTVSFLLIPGTLAQTVMNGSFEAVQIGSPFKSINTADVPGWTKGGDTGDALLWAIGYSDCCGSIMVAGDGNQFVTLGGGFNTPGTADWSTTITGLTAGNSYVLNFMTATEQGPNFPAAIFPQTMTVGFISGSSTASQSFPSP